ncbi:FtsX-like permease family protein [Tateyamaria sp. ANG-S1]|uniref:cell division protein FtsX n=1 Tax=Tateyamaria sp. ANG-S1 TaxID=1577905 RepID=UPI00057C68DA|nr:FtsX-like permease family protein [Tateyamaria sp. ANG-S1]KIC51290.1 cell division protein FtsX [Tateyamaria sp. ANG-S1]
MKFDLKTLRALVAGDRYADRVVPPTGFTAQLTLFVSGAMAFLAVFAMALSLASGRLADRWGDELARTATIRIVAPEDQSAIQTNAALQVLSTTPGVAEARALTDEEQQALLAPWFGQDLPLDTLPVPRLIEIQATDQGFDVTGLRLRLAAEVPGAVLDDHGRWRAPLVSAAQRLRLLGWTVALLIIGAVAAMVTLAANAALAANAQVIAVLRLVGATDSYIANAFVRRFTLRALAGSACGAVIGVAAVWLMPSGGDTPGFLTGLGFQGAGWLVPLLLPPVCGGVALLATAYAASRALRTLT